MFPPDVAEKMLRFYIVFDAVGKREVVKRVEGTIWLFSV